MTCSHPKESLIVHFDLMPLYACGKCGALVSLNYSRVSAPVDKWKRAREIYEEAALGAE